MHARLRALSRAIAVAAVLGHPAGSMAQEGSCGHDEMRTWVDQEEICYHLYGPLTEHWSLANQDNLDALDTCLRTARKAYHDRRMVCELRGETAYRTDGIHKDWERYQRAYRQTVKRLQGGS